MPELIKVQTIVVSPKVAHGGKNSEVRHVGDLGNIVALNGMAFIHITDDIIALSPGSNSVRVIY
jgi:Cu/Zn superoxide dismutase